MAGPAGAAGKARTEAPDSAAIGSSMFPCSGCGGQLEFSPGTDSLKCPFCGVLNTIDDGEGLVDEQDLLAAFAELEGRADAEAADTLTIKCTNCGGEAALGENITSGTCPFCGTPQVATRGSRRLIRPQALLPFAVEAGKARELFRTWLAGLWMAPSDLKKVAALNEGLQGWYKPFWTYDSVVTTDYSGQRGDDYYVPVTRMVMVGGKMTARTIMQRRTRWSNVSGRVRNTFDDLLVSASESMPPKHANLISTWNTRDLVVYQDEYIAGFHTESYTVPLREGLERAKVQMLAAVKRTIRFDIGGDQQRIGVMTPHYASLTYKHILVPIWIAAYRYSGTSYRFLINGRTGEVAGDRPYSAAKITGAIIGGLVVAAIVVLVVMVMSR